MFEMEEHVLETECEKSHVADFVEEDALTVVAPQFINEIVPTILKVKRQDDIFVVEIFEVFGIVNAG